MTEEQVTKRAEEAGRIINSAAYTQAWTEVEKSLVRAWMETKPTETNEREAIWHQWRNLKEAHRALSGFLEDGKALERKKQRRNGNANWNPA